MSFGNIPQKKREKKLLKTGILPEMRTDIKSEVNIIKNIATNIIILLTSSIVVVYVHSKLSVNHCSI